MNTRQIFAALANSDTRDMHARVTLGQVPEAPTSKQSRALQNLQRAGLIDTPDGAWDHPEQPSCRHCVDTGYITRTPDGSEYRR